MEQRTLGETGIEVSVLGLGTWAFGGWSYGALDDAEAVQIVETALEAGIDFFDTASNYGRGRSEEILGEVLAGHRDRVVLCTKGGTAVEAGKAVKRFDPKSLEASLSESLRRLRTDRVDFFLFHNPSGDELEFQPMYDWVTREIKRGRIGHWGASLYGDPDDLYYSVGTGAEAIMARFSALRNEFAPLWEDDAVELAWIARSPFESGFLSGKYGPGSTFDPERDHRSRSDQGTLAAVARALEVLGRLVVQGDAESLAEAALRYATHHPRPSVVVAGATRVATLRENLAAHAKGPLSSRALAVIEEARAVFLGSA